RDRPDRVASAVHHHASDTAAGGVDDQALFLGFGLLSPDSLRLERTPLHPLEVPHDGTGRSGATLRNLSFERNVRAGVQGVEGPAPDAGGTDPAPALDRRASSAVECNSGRYESGRPPAASTGGGFALPALAAPTSLDETGNHLSL